MRNQDNIWIVNPRATCGDRSKHDKGYILEFQIPRVGGVKKETHDSN
jgi:hypothetical protein